MSPEVIKGENYNKKVDIWAFGCIIYELFTLNVCFESKSLYGFVNNILNKNHGKINLKIYNSKWQELIDKLLNKDYKKRPDINELYNLLLKLKSNLNIKSENKKIEILSTEKLDIKKKEKENFTMRCKS